MANINKDRFHQINEKQTRQLQEIVKDAEIDDHVLLGIEENRRRELEIENVKRYERLQGKYVSLGVYNRV